MNELTDASKSAADFRSSAEPKRSPRRSAAAWRELIEQQAAGGLSIAAFCREYHLPQSGFYQWRRRLRSAAISAGNSSTAFVRLEPADDDGPITVRFGDHMTLHCPAEYLEQLVPLLMREAKAC